MEILRKVALWHNIGLIIIHLFIFSAPGLHTEECQIWHTGFSHYFLLIPISCSSWYKLVCLDLGRSSALRRDFITTKIKSRERKMSDWRWWFNYMFCGHNTALLIPSNLKSSGQEKWISILGFPSYLNVNGSAISGGWPHTVSPMGGGLWGYWTDTTPMERMKVTPNRTVVSPNLQQVPSPSDIPRAAPISGMMRESQVAGLDWTVVSRDKTMLGAE